MLDGTGEMHCRQNGSEAVAGLQAGDVFFAESGSEHVAHPRGEARILVIEHAGPE